jgi:DNA polymerase III gamma/tau subunit
VQKFALRKITLDELIERLQTICKAEKIEADRDALEIIARRGEGSVRDALSLLDQVIAFSGRSINATDVATVLGLSDTSFFARLMTLIAAGDHAAVLDALNEAASTGRDFKMLYRDLLNFVRNLLLIAGGANASLIAASPDEMQAIESAAKAFSYSELLRVANLLVRDDEIVNRAEHQRMAVEVALLKAATFPRLRAVEEALSGAAALPPAPAQTKTAGKSAGAAPKDDVTPLIERLQKARPLIAGYLSSATKSIKAGDRITFTFNDSFYADAVNDAKSTIEEVAREVYGSQVTVVAETTSKAAQPAAAGVADDPVLKAFQKHLGGEVVETRRSK